MACHLPGYAIGSSTFALRPYKIMPRPIQPTAEIVGAFALTTAHRLLAAIDEGDL